MRVSIEMFGYQVDLGDVPDKSKRKYKKRKGAKAPSAPRKDKMVHEAPNVKG